MHIRLQFVALAVLIAGVVWPAAVRSEKASAAGAAVSQAAGSPAAIVGLWLVSPYPDRPSDMEVAVFDTGGFMFASNAPSMQVTPGGAPSGATQMFGSQGYGLWQSQPDGTVTFKFIQISYDQNGGFQGYASIRGNLTLDASVATFSGMYTVTITSPDGTSAEVQGPTAVTGMRVGL